MSQTKPGCDLCALSVEISGLELKTKAGIKRFCCEGCLGIYRLLHEDEIAEEMTGESQKILVPMPEKKRL